MNNLSREELQEEGRPRLGDLYFRRCTFCSEYHPRLHWRCISHGVDSPYCRVYNIWLAWRSIRCASCRTRHVCSYHCPDNEEIVNEEVTLHEEAKGR